MFRRMRIVVPALLTYCAAACAAGDGNDRQDVSDDSAGDGASADGAASGGDEGAGDGGDSAGGEAGNEAGGEPGKLTAGEWRDLDHWDFWRDIMQGDWSPMVERWGYDTSRRVSVHVRLGEVPVADATVVLSDGQQNELWHAKTDNLGRAELFAGLFGSTADGPLSLRVESGDASVAMPEIPSDGEAPITVELPSAVPSAGLDLMFVVDTTGSMGDELSYLQVELADVIARVGKSSTQSLDLRLSVNFYRDQGDEYVVRPFPFTTDIEFALQRLQEQGAGGGDDFEEAVEEALEDAVYEHEWRANARARLLFLVLDAPPHHTQDRVELLHDVTREAAALGIRIIPLSASGIDKNTEFLLRFLDISTAGTYTFVTDHSGIGGDHLEPTIGEYQVELLNDLLVRIISQAIQAEG